MFLILDDSSTNAMSSSNNGEQVPNRPLLADCRSSDYLDRSDSVRSKSLSNGDLSKMESTSGKKKLFDAVNSPANASSSSVTAELQPKKALQLSRAQQSIHNLIEGHDGGMLSPESPVTPSTTATTPTASAKSPTSPFSPIANQPQLSSSLPTFGDSLTARVQAADQKWPMSPNSLKDPTVEAASAIRLAPSTSSVAEKRQLFLAELSALEYFVVRNVAVLRLQPLVNDRYSVNDLLALIRESKRSLWSKFISTLKPVKKPVKAKGGFPIW